MLRISDLRTGLETESADAEELLRSAVDSITNRIRRKELENWTLKNFFDAYNQERAEKYEWVKPSEAPDYQVFTDPSSNSLPVEVTEILDPRRKTPSEV